MPETRKLPAELAARLCCPRCKAPVAIESGHVRCAGCEALYPVVAGIPVLFNEEASLFDNAAIEASAGAPPDHAGTLKRVIRAAIPPISRNYRAVANYRKLSGLLEEAGGLDVLVLGAGIAPAGLDLLHETGHLRIVETDVYVGPRTGLICDAHDIPFADATFDAVIIQGVICWLQDPERAVAEIHRVLKPDALVYAETPFVQQNTGGAHDFVRYTHVGHRRLFGHFAEVDSGPVGGPGMVLAWSWAQFLTSFATSKTMRSALRALASFTAFWLPLLDRWLGRRPCAIDGASGVFFMGRRSESVVPDRTVIRTYRGCVGW